MFSFVKDLIFALFPILVVIGIIILVVVKVKMHIRIKYKTFFKRGFLPKRGNFGLYVYTGAQGKGKTYSLVEYLIDNSDHIIAYSNITGIKNVKDIHYYCGFDGLLQIKKDLDSGVLKIPKKKQLVIVYDEVFTELQRGDKVSKGVLDFLCQMRKRKIIFLTTAQYWSELPITYRRFCRYQIDCNMINLFVVGFLIKIFHDAEQMKWSNDDMDFIAPITETSITKCRKIIANSYDTFLRISSSNVVSENVKALSPKEQVISTNEILILTGDKRGN